MAYDKERVAAKLLDWKQFMQDYHLPSWEELPDLELYMDQVVSLVSRYVALQRRSGDSEPVLTPSAVNNYVRLKLVPPPVKKRYSREHLAYLIVFCSLKHSMSLADIQQLMPLGLSSQEVQTVYNSFLTQYRTAYLRCVEQLEQLAAPTLDPDCKEDNTVDNLVLTTAVAATLYKIVTGKLLALQIPKEPEET